MRHPRRFFFVAMLLCGFLAGCGGARDKGKNQDYDRPKAPEKK
jgi:hypothetical protein